MLNFLMLLAKPLPENTRRALWIIGAGFLILTFLLWPRLPLKDAVTYFNFADSRSFLGVPYFHDVFSNIGFLVAGIWGLRWISSAQALPSEMKTIARALAVATLFVSVGSSYFHWAPTPDRLFWDRVPMAFGFVTLVSLVLADRVHLTAGLRAFAILNSATLFILTLWKSGVIDYRPYLMIQYGGLILITAINLLRPRGIIPAKIVWSSLGLYALAKVLEKNDQAIFLKTEVTSGHSLKHWAAALALLILFSAFRNKAPSSHSA